jgi:hypothetical protein
MADDPGDGAAPTCGRPEWLAGRLCRFELRRGALNGRVGAIETGQSRLHRERAYRSGRIAGRKQWMDRFDERLARIGRQPDLTEA